MQSSRHQSPSVLILNNQYNFIKDKIEFDINIIRGWIKEVFSYLQSVKDKEKRIKTAKVPCLVVCFEASDISMNFFFSGPKL